MLSFEKNLCSRLLDQTFKWFRLQLETTLEDLKLPYFSKLKTTYFDCRTELGVLHCYVSIKYCLMHNT